MQISSSENSETLLDLSCLFLLEIPLESSTESGFNNGILIKNNQYGYSSSHLGMCDGCGDPGRYGAPSTWQVMNLSEFQKERTTKHHFLHALGMNEEHQRTGINVPGSLYEGPHEGV